VIGPGRITSRTIYGAPAMPTAGADLVVVNGVVVWRVGLSVGDWFPGRIVCG
jgi:N-acyl-D-aspartate/D-glutamate deacylase